MTKLPLDIIERVLSFLSVPVLCRMRSVCKTWNELIGRPRFHDLCDLNGKNNVYLLMWREYGSLSRGISDPAWTLSFLDLDAQRWHSIKLPRVCARENEIESRFMAMDDGLICELTTSSGTDNNFAFTLSDPVARTWRTLPAPPQFYSPQDSRYHIVTVVGDVVGSYKVFLLNSLYQTPEWKSLPRVYEYESSTNEWCRHRNLPNGVEKCWASSAVVLDQTVIVEQIHTDSDSDKVTLLSYKLQEDAWVEVWQMSFPRDIIYGRLVVSENRLILVLWSQHSRNQILDPLRFQHDCRNSESQFRTSQDYIRTLFEMCEILIAENGRKKLVQLPHSRFQHVFGGNYPSPDVNPWLTTGFPSFDSNGMCNSVVLVNTSTGHVRRYCLATGSVDSLTRHPLVQSSEEPAQPLNFWEYRYVAKTMKRSLRNLLAQHLTTLTSTGWRLSQ